MFTTRPNVLHIAFRVAGFVRVGQTTFPSISPVTCDSDTARATSQLFEFYFLSDHAIKIVHNTASANASQTVRLISQVLTRFVPILRLRLNRLCAFQALLYGD